MTIKDSLLADEAIYVYNLSFCDLYFYTDFIISEIFEGVVVGKDHIIEIINLIDKHYGFEKPYGLISHRTHSYSTNLSEIMPLASEFGLLIANAVVAYNKISLSNFDLERRLLNRLVGEAFSNINDAIIWTQSIVNTYTKESC